METYLGEVILAIILIVVAFIFKSTISGKMDEVNKKLDTVIKNQGDQNIEIEKIKKDVGSNASYGKESKGKIEELVGHVNALNLFMASSIEKFKNLEK